MAPKKIIYIFWGNKSILGGGSVQFKGVSGYKKCENLLS